MSKQESAVSDVLNNIFDDVETQVDLSKITKRLIHKGIIVDFWIPSKNCVIEVHGIQHFKPSGFGRNKVDTKKAFSAQVERDDRLRRACDSNSLDYIEIKHDEGISSAMIIRKVMHLLNESENN